MPDARLQKTRDAYETGTDPGDENDTPRRQPPTPAPGAHPHRLAGTHDGMYVTEHHRPHKKKP